MPKMVLHYYTDNNTCDKQLLCHYLYIYVQIIKFCCCLLFTLHARTQPGTSLHTQDGKDPVGIPLGSFIGLILTNGFLQRTRTTFKYIPCVFKRQDSPFASHFVKAPDEPIPSTVSQKTKTC